jgi:ATP-binding cassette, subfamily F, member 3
VARDAITISDLHKAHGMQVLFDGAGVTIRSDHRLAVVGRNGTGKSTLCKMIIGQDAPDSGSISLARGLRIGYLEQSDPFQGDETVQEALERLSDREGWRCAEVAARFRIGPDILDQPARSLSGGWQTRTRLCALLLGEPDLLILDEPTNYLDLRTQLLLEGFLSSWKGGYLVVSHDRAFLRRTCTGVLSVANGNLEVVDGGIDTWLNSREERREMAKRRNANLATKAKHLQDFVDRNSARASSATQAQSKAKQLEKLKSEFVEEEADAAAVAMRLPKLGERRPGAALRVTELEIGYDARVIAGPIDLEVERGHKVAVLGDNGQGKSTLLRTLAGALPPISGTMKWGHAIRVGFYHQHVYEAIPSDCSVKKWLERCAAESPGYVTTQEVLNLAGAFLFRGLAVDKTAAVLSGGERARLALAGLLIGRHDVLLLDEPTNHLDVETTEALANALAEHEGTVILVSHDRAFVSRLATGIIELREGSCQSFTDGYESYLWRVEQEMRGGDATEAKASEPKTARTTKAETATLSNNPAERKEQRRRQNAAKNTLRNAEKILRDLERERDELTLVLQNDPSGAGINAGRRLAAMTSALEQAEEAWLEASTLVDSLGGSA